jgi:cardiolipin synthase
MTTANKITLGRIALIPFFVVFALYYGRSVAAGVPEEWLRWMAVGAFGFAAATDGVDGFIARRYGQRTDLGAVLDPIADKGLLLAAIVTLSFSRWAYELPIWFTVVVISRDIIVMMGAVGLMLLQGKVAVRPTWAGKAATCFQMGTLVAVMLQVEITRQSVVLGGRVMPLVWLDLPVVVAALLTVVSGVEYSTRAMVQLHSRGWGQPGGGAPAAVAEVEGQDPSSGGRGANGRGK